jgi:hypothetical protein
LACSEGFARAPITGARRERRSPWVAGTADVPAVYPRVAQLDDKKCQFAGTLCKPSDGLEPSTPSLPSRARAVICEHVCPANRPFAACGQWSRVTACALADVPVSYPRGVVRSQNTQPAGRASELFAPTSGGRVATWTQEGSTRPRDLRRDRPLQRSRHARPCHTRAHCSCGSSAASGSTPHGYAKRLETFAAHLRPRRPPPYHLGSPAIGCDYPRLVMRPFALALFAATCGDLRPLAP